MLDFLTCDLQCVTRRFKNVCVREEWVPKSSDDTEYLTEWGGCVWVVCACVWCFGLWFCFFPYSQYDLDSITRIYSCFSNVWSVKGICVYFENSTPILISLFLQSAVSSTGENTKH